MKTRDEFVRRRQTRWQELERLLEAAPRLQQSSAQQISAVASHYRAVCADLMYARSMGYGHDLVEHLDGLAARAHNELYGPSAFSAQAVREFLNVGFARCVRNNLRLLVAASAAFWLPLAFGLAATLQNPDFALSVLPASALEQMARSYSDGLTGRGEIGSDSAMAGFYVHNNISIAFRCFATGILFGLGSLFFLIYNGLTIGTVVGHVINAGAGVNILTFMCGHGPFELTAICLSGAAGLKMGYALIDTGGLTRLASLRAQAPQLVQMVAGAALMLLAAALIEGYWSPSGLARELKWGFSGLVSVALVSYFALAGRSNPATTIR